MGDPENWLFIRESPNLKWMITRVVPLFQETTRGLLVIWSDFTREFDDLTREIDGLTRENEDVTREIKRIWLEKLRGFNYGNCIKKPSGNET